MAGPNPIGDLIQGKQGIHAAQALLDYGKQTFDAAEQKNNNSGTGAKLALQPYMDSLKAFETENGTNGNADAAIPAIAAQSALAGYDGGGVFNWFASGNQMNGDILLAAQKTYATTYDKRSPADVAKSVLQSLHVNPDTHQDAMTALQGMDQNGLKTLDQRAKALAKIEFKKGDVDGTAVQRLNGLRDSMLDGSSDRLLQDNDLHAFKDMLGKLGESKVNPQDLDGVAWRKALLAASSEGDGYAPSAAVAKIVSHVNWDDTAVFDNAPVHEAAPPIPPVVAKAETSKPEARNPTAIVNKDAPAHEAPKPDRTAPKVRRDGSAHHIKRKHHYAGSLRNQKPMDLRAKAHVGDLAASTALASAPAGPATETVNAWGMNIQVPVAQQADQFTARPMHGGGPDAGNPIAAAGNAVGQVVGGIVAIPLGIVEGVAQGVGTVLSSGGKVPAGGTSYGNTYNRGGFNRGPMTWKP